MNRVLSATQMDAIRSVIVTASAIPPRQEAGDRRRAGSGRAAEADQLQDRAVPDVGGARLGAVVGVVHRILDAAAPRR